MSEEEEEGDFLKTVDFRGFRRQGAAEGEGGSVFCFGTSLTYCQQHHNSEQ